MIAHADDLWGVCYVCHRPVRLVMFTTPLYECGMLDMDILVKFQLSKLLPIYFDYNIRLYPCQRRGLGE